MVELTIEQQFRLRSLEAELARMTSEQKSDYILELVRQSMAKELLFKQFTKGESDSWKV
jgi:Phycobilisome degradation protein nblA.